MKKCLWRDEDGCCEVYIFGSDVDFCSHHSWVFRGQVLTGLRELADYLRNDPHPRFEAWLREHGQAA